jgi:hypothetical protein
MEKRLARARKAEMADLLFKADLKAIPRYEFMGDDAICRAWLEHFGDEPPPSARKLRPQYTREEILSE